LSGSLGSTHYSQVAKSSTNSEASIAKLFPVSQANEVTRPDMASEPTDEATVSQTERADEPVKLGKDSNNPASAKADTYVSNAVTDLDNETAGEQASDRCEESSNTKNVLVEDKTVLEVNKPLVADQETPKERGVDGDLEKNIGSAVVESTVQNHVISGNEPVVEKATTILSITSVPMEQQSWIHSIETLSHYTASLEQLSDTAAEDDLVKISSHVMHLVNPSKTSSEVVNEMKDKPLEDLVESIISRISSNTTNTTSPGIDVNTHADKEDIISIESAQDDTETSHQTHYYRPVTPPSTNVSDSDSDTEENKGLIARVSSMLIGRKQSKTSSLGTLKEEPLKEKQSKSTFVSRVSAMILKPSDVDTRMNKSKMNLVLDGIGEGDSQSMDTTTISSSILSSVFSSEQSSLTSQSHDVEIHALASGEMAGVEEIIPEHQTTSTLKRNVFRRASHKIKKRASAFLRKVKNT